uniref:Uncharacterized protein n=1 Tax=Arundo donax TaxID=35708 RepID=A0A0A9GCA9_ARUDO
MFILLCCFGEFEKKKWMLLLFFKASVTGLAVRLVSMLAHAFVIRDDSPAEEHVLLSSLLKHAKPCSFIVMIDQ